MSPARNIGIPGITPPEEECDDPNCPFHGRLSVRGLILEGVVVSTRMRNTVVIRHDYLHYDKKYKRYERRRKKIHAHLPPCIEVKEGDLVIIGECRPIAKTVSFVVLGKKK
ncbi:MAG: 30S ribosomal protein S17 [Thermoprotei archaeon]|nr:MAG: 30S ribosomal protein S17 [Thermoprotei archaeon]RLF03609.1 MAG: 30S ribosomal protein S17 [Thermoprotei archaeon]